VLATPDAVVMPWAEDVGAILATFYAGQGMGDAVARTLLGFNNPAGKLTTTFPQRIEDIPGWLTYPGEAGRHIYSEGVFVGYRGYDARGVAPLFPFGFGLSYTSFAYDDLVVSPATVAMDDELAVRFRLTNTGDRDGAEIAQVYARAQGPPASPLRELKAFARVPLRKEKRGTWNCACRRVISPAGIRHSGSGGLMPARSASRSAHPAATSALARRLKPVPKPAAAPLRHRHPTGDPAGMAGRAPRAGGVFGRAPGDQRRGRRCPARSQRGSVPRHPQDAVLVHRGSAATGGTGSIPRSPAARHNLPQPGIDMERMMTTPTLIRLARPARKDRLCPWRPCVQPDLGDDAYLHRLFLYRHLSHPRRLCRGDPAVVPRGQCPDRSIDRHCHRPAPRPRGTGAPVPGMGCGALGVATALVFVPVGQAVAVKVTWAIASFLLLSLTYSFVNTAYGMLTNLMTASTTQRIQLTTARLIGANVGSVAIGWITLPMVALLGMGSARQGFRCS
jgi:hypothetical protein